MPGATNKSTESTCKQAGVPEAVIKRANEVLREIERETVIDPLTGSKRGRRSSKYTQSIFFDRPERNRAWKKSRYLATQLRRRFDDRILIP